MVVSYHLLHIMTAGNVMEMSYMPVLTTPVFIWNIVINKSVQPDSFRNNL